MITDFFKKISFSSASTPKGSGGAEVHGGYIVEHESSYALTGTTKYKTYSEIMANTSIVAAGVRHSLNLAAKPNWKAVPINDSGEAKRYAEMVMSIMEDMSTPWSRIIRRAAMYRFIGFSIQEWTAKKRDDGVIGMYDISPRPQQTIERWSVDKEGKVQGVWQRRPQDSQEIWLPREKIIYVVDDAINDTPQGVGLLRHVVEPAERLKVFEALEAHGFESDLRGIPIGRGPFAKLQELVDQGTLTPAQKLAMEAPLKNFIKKHVKNPSATSHLGLLLDSLPYVTRDDAETPSSVKQWDVDLLQHQSTTQQEVNTAIERINREIARILGVEGLLLGSTSVGSMALSRDKTQNLLLMIESTLEEIQESLQRDFINTIWELNGWPKEFMCKLSVEPIHHQDVEYISTVLEQLASAGAILAPDDPAINEIRQLLRLSKAPKMVQDSLINNGETNNVKNQ